MKQFVILAFLLLLFSEVGTTVYAQISSPTNNHTASEEAEGKIIWQKLQAKQLECKNLTEDNFEVLGEYFMGQMAGGSHEFMNNMMVRMMGEEGEKQMHIAMGKRNSGCETSLKFPQSGTGFMPMMWNFGQNPMGWFGFAAWVVTLTWIIWLVVGVLLAVWLWKKINKK